MRLREMFLVLIVVSLVAAIMLVDVHQNMDLRHVRKLAGKDSPKNETVNKPSRNGSALTVLYKAG